MLGNEGRELKVVKPAPMLGNEGRELNSKNFTFGEEAIYTVRACHDVKGLASIVVNCVVLKGVGDSRGSDSGRKKEGEELHSQDDRRKKHQGRC